MLTEPPLEKLTEPPLQPEFGQSRLTKFTEKQKILFAGAS